MSNQQRILLIYAGGTIGMAHDSESGALSTMAFDRLYQHLPELAQLDVDLTGIQVEQPSDSANAGPALWTELADLVGSNYNDYDGFVILHGTDTMVYTGAALSFMFENLGKPVILTGSLLPVGILRTDGKENILTAIEIAATKDIPEVGIYFENQLFRANRTIKYSAEAFGAFRSPSCEPLLHAGVHLKPNESGTYRSDGPFSVRSKVSAKVGAIRLFPGMHPIQVDSVLQSDHLEVIVIETYGSGTGPTENWLTQSIEQAIEAGKILINVSQCSSGLVDQSLYQTSQQFLKAGVVTGKDMTFETAIVKSMFLLAQIKNPALLSLMISTNLRGELTD